MTYGIPRNFRFAAAVGIFLSTWLSPSISSGQEISDSHLAAARAAINSMQSTIRLDNLLPEMGEAIKNQLIANHSHAADKIVEIVDEATLELAARRGALEREIALSHARIFTEEELLEIAAFHETETGKKLIRQIPDIENAIREATRIWASGLERDLNIAISRKMQEEGI